MVNSVKHDLFQPFPPEFDLAVMDRFAAYIPGWEMPKNSSAFLTNNYGFITDYLAEAFHHQFKHTNRYEEVTKRIRLGKSVEGRDEKGIKKTVCAFLKILHPTGTATDEDFEEYVAYAVECRRRVKEQMNKRKPDDEFARINLSYVRADGHEVVVFCPESKDASATQQPARTSLSPSEAGSLVQGQSHTAAREIAPAAATTSVEATNAAPAPIVATTSPRPKLAEQHFTILYGDSGHTYESIMGPYLKGAKTVQVEDPYIRMPHQIQNFVRFCEAIMKAGTVRKISLLTSFDDTTPLADMNDKLDQLRQSLLEQDMELEISVNPNLHDREIRLDNGWVIKIGRGLDFYQKPASWFEIGAMDMSLRKCLDTKVDIYMA